MSTTLNRRAMQAPGSTTSDITLSRGRDDYLLKQGTATERVLADKDDKLIDQAHTIKCLQNQGKFFAAN